MISPEVSRYQTTPWQPTIDTSNDKADQVEAATQYDAVYGGSPTYSDSSSSNSSNPFLSSYDMPTMTAAYTQAPDVIVTYEPPAGPSSGSTLAAPTSSKPVIASIAEMRATQQSLLGVQGSAIDTFNGLKSAVQTALDPVNDTFGAHVMNPTGAA